jgi:8-oxo-dGTP pyrophosphatase MutT (NUDIX family)
MLNDIVNAAFRTAFRIAYPLAMLARSTKAYSHNGAGVAIWHNDTVLLVQHSYRRGLLLPGGGIRSLEVPEEALVREMHEELGITLDPTTLMLVDKQPRTHGKGLAYLFETHIHQKPVVTIDHREIIFADFVHIANVTLDMSDGMHKTYLTAKKAAYSHSHISP